MTQDRRLGLQALARAALTYLAEPGDPALGALLEFCAPAEVLAAIKAGMLPRTGPGCGDNPASRRALERALGRWRIRLPHLPGDGQIAATCRDGIRLVCPGDSEWPASLDELGPARPYALWLRGTADLRLACLRSVSIVGSRAASGYGEHVAGEIAADLGERGWAVVSGGAYGIDAAAHRGALATEAITIAVLACGVDYPYPAGHADLFAAIAAQGLVVSEWPPGRHPARLRFLVRNRTIAAMTCGTVIVEAGQRSGALNTARHAAELGRPLMAVPGPVTSAQSAGCHKIIRDWAATCVTRAADIIEMLSPVSVPDGCAPSRGRDLAPVPSRDDLDYDSARVLDAFPSRGGAGPATIAVEAGVDLDTVLRCLGLLAGCGFIERCDRGWRLRKLALPGGDLGLVFELELAGAVPGELLQAITLDVIRVGQADRPHPLSRQPLVDLVEMITDQPFFGVGGLALVWLAGVFQGRVVKAVTAHGAVRRRPRAAPGRPGGEKEFFHRVVGGQLVEGVGLQDDAARLDVIGEVQVNDRDSQSGPLQGLGFLGESLDLDWAVAKFGVLVHHDARQCVVMRDELAAQVAEPDSLLAHARSLSRRWCGSVPRPRRRVEDHVGMNAWITLPEGRPLVKLQFDRRVGIRNYSRPPVAWPVPGLRHSRDAD